MFLENFQENMHINSFVIDCALRKHDEPLEKYIEGILTVTVKRDCIGIPFLAISNFVPKTITGPFMLVPNYIPIVK